MYAGTHEEEKRTQRLAGRTRKVVVTKEEMMYVPLLETLQSLLNNTTVYEEVHTANTCTCTFTIYGART